MRPTVALPMATNQLNLIGALPLVYHVVHSSRPSNRRRGDTSRSFCRPLRRRAARQFQSLVDVVHCYCVLMHGEDGTAAVVDVIDLVLLMSMLPRFPLFPFRCRRSPQPSRLRLSFQIAIEFMHALG